MVCTSIQPNHVALPNLLEAFRNLAASHPLFVVGEENYDILIISIALGDLLVVK
jgi:hypothetical protein